MNATVRTTPEAKKHDEERSPEWSARRKDFLAKNPACACCGKTAAQVGLQAHHVFPFHYGKHLGRPDLELDERNLITLCETEAREPAENHHLLVGHLKDFESSNLDVRADALVYKNKTAAQIEGDAAWQAKHNNRLPHIEQMTAEDKAAFQWAMQETYPVAGASFPKPAKNRFPWLPKYLQDRL